jgi:archaellum component FlaF (FlaF/FlaG flagellin family)
VSNAVISLIALAIMISTVMAVLNSMFESNQKTSRAFIAQADSAVEQTRSAVEVIDINSFSESTNSKVDVTVRNTGEVEFGDFRDWDINVEYLDQSSQLNAKRLSFASIASDDAWTVQAIYQDSSNRIAEIVGTDVLNEGEEVVIRLQIIPAILGESTGRIVVTPPVGAPSSGFFSG